MTNWLQQARQELSQSWAAAETLGFAEKYQVRQNHTHHAVAPTPPTSHFLSGWSGASPPQVLQHFTDTFTEQRRPVTTLLGAVKRRPELSQQQSALMTAYNCLEEEVRNQNCRHF